MAGMACQLLVVRRSEAEREPCPAHARVDITAQGKCASLDSCSEQAGLSQVWAAASGLADVKASVNWMYAAKMGAEGAAMYDAAAALRDAMLALGLACDGGKDSLSMAAAAGGETVKGPGNLVVSCIQRTYVLVVSCLYYFTSRQPV